MKHLILTSTSAVKIAVVKETFPDYEVIAIKTPTEIEQPFGYLETRRLCRSRVYAVEEMLSTKLPIISIESGIQEVIGGYADFVYVVIETNEDYNWDNIAGDNLLIPEEYQHYVTEAKEKGFATTTFGEVLNSYNPSIPKDNWQEQLCGVSRKDQIKQVLKLAEGLL